MRQAELRKHPASASQLEYTNMIVLRQNRVFLKYIGLLLTDNQNSNSEHIIFNIFYTMPMAVIVAFSIGYFFKNMSDMSKATEASYPIIGISLYFAEYWAFALQKIDFRNLLADLQDIVDMSMYLNRTSYKLLLIRYFLQHYSANFNSQ